MEDPKIISNGNFLSERNHSAKVQNEMPKQSQLVSIKTQVTEPPEISMVSDDPYLSQLVTRKTSVQEPQSFSLGPMRISMQAFV